MAIEIDIAHVARLARMGLDDDLLDAYGAQLEVILEHAAKVQSLDTEGVEPTAHPPAPARTTMPLGDRGGSRGPACRA